MYSKKVKVAFKVNIVGVGFGHLKRCLSIAELLLEKGHAVSFYIDTNEVDYLFNALNVNVVYVNENSFFERFNEQVADIVFFDGAFADDIYIEQFKRHCLNRAYIVILDSLKKGVMGADLLINPGLYAVDYYQNIINPAQYLLGAAYTILGVDYREKGEYKVQKPQNILITMGGMDPQNITIKILPKLLKSYDEMTFNVVVGKYFADVESLRKLKEEFSNLLLLENLSSLRNVMISSDLCISASGTTVYEIARCGVPTVLFAQDANQLYIADYWAKTGGIINFGYYNNNRVASYVEQIAILLRDDARRMEMSNKLLENSTFGTANLVNEVLEKFDKWVSK